MIVVRALWEGEILETENFDDEQVNTAERYFSSTVEKYERMDSVGGEVTVQLIDENGLAYEKTVL